MLAKTCLRSTRFAGARNAINFAAKVCRSELNCQFQLSLFGCFPKVDGRGNRPVTALKQG